MRRLIRKSILSYGLVSGYVFLLSLAAAIPRLEPASPCLAADGKAEVSFSPQNSFLTPTELCTLQVRIASSYDSLACMECKVSFNSSLVTLISVEEGGLFEDSGYPTFFSSTITAQDTASAVDCLLGYQSYFLPPGELVRFIFRTDNVGSCSIRIVSLKLWDINRIEYNPIVDPNAWIFIGSPTGIKPEPIQRGWLKSYPNPFNPPTTITFLRSNGRHNQYRSNVKIAIYNNRGRMVRMLYEGTMQTGEMDLTWNGDDENGKKVSSGVYFAIAKTNSEVYKTKLVLIK